MPDFSHFFTGVMTFVVLLVLAPLAFLMWAFDFGDPVSLAIAAPVLIGVGLLLDALGGN